MDEDDRLREEPDEPVDNLTIYLRSYMTGGPGWKRGGRAKRGSSEAKNHRPVAIPDWVLVFDTETTTTPDQRLRFGYYQLRHRGRLFEAGFFYDPLAQLSDDETASLATLLDRQREEPLRTYLRTRAEFVEEVLYQRAYAVGAMIVGFNLPFDMSRLAITHVPARYDMAGGFSFILSKKPGQPPISVKHISQKAAFIRFTGMKAKEPKKGKAKGKRTDRGFFVDVKTLAAAMTGAQHSLESLSALLQVRHAKHASMGHGRRVTRRYARYCMRDVQSTWECFDKLAKRYADLGLRETGPWELYSEASLGKAYLKAMRIKAWRQCQPHFSAGTIGKIMSTYFGGRAEVHIRRQIVPVIHCDFLSMYPTVCTLMGLWWFVTAEGVVDSDATSYAQQLISKPADRLVEMFREQANWRKLRAIARVRPSGDIFPVRAVYKEGEPHTIGLNYLTSDEPLWFTLADVVASKILSGKTPEIVEAIAFEPAEPQRQTRPIAVAGRVLDPKKDDFYRELIIERRAVNARKEANTDIDTKARLESDQLGLKILANATSYGIFVELNPEEASRKFDVNVYASSSEFSYKSSETEIPGTYFHPLLGTLITGAARLMLALAEKQVLHHGLDWAFCDTDSMAIADLDAMPTAEFKARALKVVEWFRPLNPYGEDKSILQLEKVNFPPDRKGGIDMMEPPFCLAISAKRYALFNKDEAGGHVIRKASGHGLGHLVPPYDEPSKQRQDRIKRIGVPLWQDDLWKLIIAAADSEEPDFVDVMQLKNAHFPAASRYAATTPKLLDWFDGYNREHPNARVFPFNFLLSLQTKSEIEMARLDPDFQTDPLWKRREPKPGAPYFKDVRKAAKKAFDRELARRLPAAWLKSHGRSLVRYHMHEEAKFIGAQYDQHGILRRRHVHVIEAIPIGKESENLEENELIGEELSLLEHKFLGTALSKLRHFVKTTKKQHGLSDRQIANEANLSHRTVADIVSGRAVPPNALRKASRAVESLRKAEVSTREVSETYRLHLLALSKELGRSMLAERLGISKSYLSRLANGSRPIAPETASRIEALLEG